MESSLRLGPSSSMRGVVVYFERIATGRAMPAYGRPLSVGGVIAKHDCALAPAAQIAVPLPATIAIHGDDGQTRLRITPSDGAPALLELHEGGLVQVEAKLGVTKIDAEDGTLAAAWVLGLDTPYYAITDDAGHFRIDELAPGTYDVTFWQPPLATAGAVLVHGAPIVAHRSIRVDAARVSHVAVTLRGRYSMEQ